MKEILPITTSFKSASVILPVMNETVSLRETVDIIVSEAQPDICEFLIVVCERTQKQSLIVIEDLVGRFGTLLRVHRQSLPFLGGAVREAFDLSRGSHVIMMASDLETDPHCVKTLIDCAKQKPNAIVTASRWSREGAFYGYNPIKLFANKIFQKFFSKLYATQLTDMTYGYRLFPRKLVQTINWSELRHPFLFETIVKPLRLGVEIIEIPAVWRARTDGSSANTFLRNFQYFWTGILVRFAKPARLLRT
jgi:hypothetical protein